MSRKRCRCSDYVPGLANLEFRAGGAPVGSLVQGLQGSAHGDWRKGRPHSASSTSAKLRHFLSIIHRSVLATPGTSYTCICTAKWRCRAGTFVSYTFLCCLQNLIYVVDAADQSSARARRALSVLAPCRVQANVLTAGDPQAAPLDCWMSISHTLLACSRRKAELLPNDIPKVLVS